MFPCGQLARGRPLVDLSADMDCHQTGRFGGLAAMAPSCPGRREPGQRGGREAGIGCWEWGTKGSYLDLRDD